jgi:hypothetical protein
VHKKLARLARVPLQSAARQNEKWSMDFLAARALSTDAVPGDAD